MRAHPRDHWEAKGRPDGFFDIPNLLELDDAFIDLIDSPKIVPMMSRVTGFEAALDPDRLTPREALDWLYRLRALMSPDKDGNVL